MSLILEALRKSEAERRRGNAPDVAMELPPAAAQRARALPAWLLPAMAGLIAIALLAAWWWPRRDAQPASDASPAVAMATDAPRVETPAQPVVVARPATPPPAPPPAATAQRDIAPAAHGESAAPAVAPPPPPSAPKPVPADDPPAIDATSMPPVKLSMHMWDESPARRFVILNGQRMGEGDRNGDIAVVAIERDGVVIERNGQRAKIALP